MNKAELIDIVATRTLVTRKETNAMLDAILDVIVMTVADGEKVLLVGFGSFEARNRVARSGRNPKTNEPLQIPATVVPAFSAGKDFKKAVKK